MTEISIAAHHVSITPAIKEYVELKLGKLDKFLGDIQKIDVDMDVKDVSSKDERHQIKVTVWATGAVFRAEEKAKDMYASVDLLMDKLEKQLRRYKDKIRGHNRHGEGRAAKENPLLAVAEKGKSKSQPKVVRHYVPKPMHPEDAAAILAGEHLSFLMFRNATTEEINVVFVDADGDIDLIEP
ncbi:MAG: ribosome-associated translation inhibitor RaiA [bacterium]|nr:ribosome-associated translation inhibitor RaiA [bacterium]